MGSENPVAKLVKRKNRIFCRLCLPSDLLKFQKVATQSGWVWRLPKVDLPARLLVH